jgi:hypothetical protein
MSKKGEKTAPTPKVEADKVDTSPVAKVDPAEGSEEQTRVESKPEAKPEPPIVVAESPRARTATVVVGTRDAQPTNLPPAMPMAAPPVDVSMGGVEDPTHMPPPKDIPGGHPNDPASTPGRVPRGDSRSLRRTTEFALVYRRETFVITRSGTVGTRGQWRVVEYPTSASASHSYAKECSRFVSEGYSDYRD